MISYGTLINEIEKHLLLAKSTNNNQQLREHLSAIRALCDVGLVQPNEQSIPQNNTTNIVTTVSPSVKLDEDGNGESIFDF